jgi:hypothetical protein
MKTYHLALLARGAIIQSALGPAGRTFEDIDGCVVDQVDGLTRADIAIERFELR